MILEILICTINEGIAKVPDVLMPPRDDVRYVVSMQWTREEVKGCVPSVLRDREDVKLVFLEGKGLSRNRNNAMANASGDILLIADDDNRYTDELIENIFEAYEAHPNADVIHFQALDMEGNPLHPYPADFVSSVELSFRRKVTVRFDERFGLGSEKLCAGEEQVWMKDAKDAGYTIIYVAKPVVMTSAGTTGDKFVGNPKVQMSKGAAFKYEYGVGESVWRSVKEAGWYMWHKKVNPIPILLNMLKGIIEI
ncbi:MAG: glycosyltransferase [Prevotellaceae bacterium]|nr:glycosyltransferase [Prevotellaceae bacterium]